MKAKEDLVVEAIRFAQDLGVKIKPGAVFDWTLDKSYPRKRNDAELPTTCNWSGAVLLMLGYRRSNPLPWNSVEKYLNNNASSKDQYWSHRFHIGFDCGYQMLIYSEGDGKDSKKKAAFLKNYKPDKISGAGVKVRKAFYKQ